MIKHIQVFERKNVLNDSDLDCLVNLLGDVFSLEFEAGEAENLHLLIIILKIKETCIYFTF